MEKSYDRFAGMHPDEYSRLYGHPPLPLYNPKRVVIGQDVWLCFPHERTVLRVTTARWNGYWVDCVPVGKTHLRKAFEHFQERREHTQANGMGNNGAFSTRDAAEMELVMLLSLQAEEARKNVAASELRLVKHKAYLLELERAVTSFTRSEP